MMQAVNDRDSGAGENTVQKSGPLAPWIKIGSRHVACLSATAVQLGGYKISQTSEALKYIC